MKQRKMQKKSGKASGLHRLVCALLCLAMLSGIVQSFFLSAHAQSTLSVKIEAQGAEKDHLTLAQEERAVLRAATDAGTQSLDYQWQILADIREEQWVNIYDGTEQTLTVSQAMLAAVLDESAAAYVRCVVHSQESEGISDPFCISIAQTAQGAAAYEVPAAAQSAVQADDAPSDDGQDMVQITVNYLDGVSGLAIYTHFSALIHRGSSYENTVISPTYLGYKPYYNAADPSAPFPSDDSEVDAPDEALVVPISIAEDYDKASYTVNVYYKAIDVPYAVKYFFQNIHDDQYSEDSSLYRQGHAKTGTIVSDAELDLQDAELKKGFTKLYHYPQAVAADGSTVFECYYDRNYSMLKFDMDGGYGTVPIYARYGTPFLVNAPTKHGYVFMGWDLLKDGKGDGIADELPATVPGESCAYAAIWERAQTKYTVAYWLQNADDDDYRYIGSVKRDAKSGTPVSPQDDLTAATPICGDKTHTKSTDHTSECYPENFKHYVYDGEKTNAVNSEITVKGDGSSVLNVYYTRKYYTLRFFYAKEYNGAQDRNPDRDPDNTFTGVRYSVVGNSTYGFGNVPKNSAWFKNHQDYSLEDLFAQLTAYTSGDKWGIIEGGLPKITDPKIAGAHYVSGVYPAEGEGYQDASDPTNGNYDQYGDRYHYFEITARYGADLTDLWPVDVFGKLRVHKPETHTANGGYKALTDINGTEGEGWGNYAYPSGWNGEYKVQYSIENANATVKGLYQKLNDTLLLGKWGTNEYEYEDSDNMTRKIKTVTTVGGKTVDSNVCYYLNFFDNGANVNWSIPRQWIYQSYVPVFQNELTESEESQIKAASAPIELGGKTYYYRNNTIYRLYNTVTTNDDNIIKSGGGDCGQTQSDLEGFAKIKDSTRYELVDNGTLTDRRESFIARFFYIRETFTLEMHSHGELHFKKTDVEFDSDLNGYIYNADGSMKEPDYPATLEKGAYTFDGWYQSPECLDGTEYKPGTKMPAGNVVLYAKWKPVQHTVRFFRTYDALLAYHETGSEEGLLASYTVDHGNVIVGVQTPDDTSGHGYTFGGWFYLRRGEKTAYTPLDIPVQSDLDVYADWGSFTAQPYRIHYALYQKESDSALLQRLAAAAGPSPVDNMSYRITAEGKEVSYVYLKQDGGYHLEIADASSGYAYQGSTRTFYPKAGDPFNQLADGYNNGYFPTIASHSITLAYEENKEAPEHNLFTFTYVFAQEIDYTVEYRYLEDGTKIKDTPTAGADGAVTKTTDKAVITERFAVVKDYIPDAFYKRLILAVDVDADGNVTSSPENLITFWYSKNEKNAYYAVHYMLQNADDSSDGTPVADAGTVGKYKNYTESTAYTEGIGAIGQKVPVPVQTFVGFEVRQSAAAVLRQGDSQTQLELTLQADDAGNSYFALQVESDGSELYIFYTRKMQNYRVYHLRYGTDVTDLASLVYNKDDAQHANGVLFEIASGEQKYGTTVTAHSEVIAGMNCVSALTQSIVLRQNDAQNYIIFYYAPLQYTVEYRPWEYGGGTLSNGIEVLDGIGEFQGSEPTAHIGYEFQGWYLDKECTVPAVSNPAAQSDLAVVTGERLTPVQINLPAMPQKTIFYAKFMPVFGDLTITRRGTADEGDGTQMFVYRITASDNPSLVNYVTIQGQGSVTVHGLGCRDYIVEQCNDWSWRYGDEKQQVTLTKAGAEVIFEAAAQKDAWLNGNSAPVTNEKDALSRKR